MTIAHNLGFPRIGAQRELKKALEAYWKGNLTEADLLNIGKKLRARYWQLQRDAGITLIPVGDFAFYDQMLNMTALLGAAPARFGFSERLTLDQYFQLARGNAQQPAMEMTKWFDTNYHYLVPEFLNSTEFNLGSTGSMGGWGLFDEVAEAQALGINAKPVLIGPLTYLYLGKEKHAGLRRISLLPKLLAVYQQILTRLKGQGMEWVQLDEPILALDLPQEWLGILHDTYAALSLDAPKILLATYFSGVEDHAARLKELPVAGLHLDLVRAPQQLEYFIHDYPTDKILSAGVVDGRNIWRCNLAAALQTLAPLHTALGNRLWIAPSCSLLHVPVDLAQETRLDAQLKNWLAFATQKLSEVTTLVHGLTQGKESIATQLSQANAALESRVYSPLIYNREVRQRVAALNADDARRATPFAQRITQQQARLNLPAFPTTTIGSFPQTADIRAVRADFKQGHISAAEYNTKMRSAIHHAVRKQEKLGLDVLVHGESERNDMVEYFGEQLSGFAFTDHAWVQSYGSRCVKPPIIYGDIFRPQAMTVEWARYAQSLTAKPMKGMLTGPITILQWSFVRDDIPRADTALQIALAIRDEVQDLEQADIAIIQIDEAALREGLPLKKSDWPFYLEWAVRAFRVCCSAVQDTTQIHTHMCYSEFNDILPAIAAMDADVITIETSRSDMELLGAFHQFHYPNDIGPGVYDIHSPRVPSKEEILRLMRKACAVIPRERLWINPDCGLKTRAWPEVEAALKNMVAVAHELRR
ncbi:MAG: 5-methyltetrahydropteroyltriglutamate--homocysteine S-methyltransferase [Gallionellaceae bacterium]|nr:5-methyltetrahydropteroyltriglutamate--homocysteine S-methyltransferase [Gallionellaceae bacterium]